MLAINAKIVQSILVFAQDTGLDQEANDAAARVAGVGGDREDRYTRSSHINCVIPLCPAVWQQCCNPGTNSTVVLLNKSVDGVRAATKVIATIST